MNNRILLSIISIHHPKKNASLISILSDHGLSILDIKQSLLGGYMTSTIIASSITEPEDSNFFETLRKSLHEHNHIYCYHCLTKNESPHIETGDLAVLTLMSNALTSTDLHSIFSAVTTEGMTITQTTQLSRYLPELQNNASCFEILLSGKPIQLEKLQQRCSTLSEKLNIDIVLQSNASKRKNYRLVAFDMDSTLIQAEVIDLLADTMGVGKQVAEITELTMRGELSFTDSFIDRLAMLKGLNESVLNDIADNISLMDGAETLIKTLKSLGYKTAIISGGFTYFAGYLQRKLGIDYIHANELEIDNGKITGQAKEPIINSERKAKILQQLAFHEGLRLDQVIAVGDGANDLAMLSLAGLGIAFRAKPLVKKQAKHAISVMGLDSILYLLGLKATEFSRIP